MGSRERKRAARQKRKTRSAERRSTEELAAETVAAPSSANGADAVPVESASERRNREAREALEPLTEGERPTVVTVAAILCTILVVLAIAGYALWDVLRDEDRPDTIGVIAFVSMVGLMAYGLWRARYWAVLGFQAALVLVILSNAISLAAALSVLQAVANVLLIALAGVLFYFMVKAMARIQMPERLPRE